MDNFGSNHSGTGALMHEELKSAQCVDPNITGHTNQETKSLKQHQYQCMVENTCSSRVPNIISHYYIRNFKQYLIMTE